MGNNTSSNETGDSRTEHLGGVEPLHKPQVLDLQRDRTRQEPKEKAKSLDDLPKTFNCLYNNVISLGKATSAQQKLVEELCQISEDKDKNDGTKLDEFRKGIAILKEMQGARFRQSMPVQESVDDLYKNIKDILLSYKIKPFNVQSHQEIYSRLDELFRKEILREDIENPVEELSRSQEKTRKPEKVMSEAHNKNDFLQEELKEGEKDKLIRGQEKGKPLKKTGRVQLFHSHSGNTIKAIETNLKASLKKHLIDIDLVKCNTLSEVDHSSPLIVLSIIATRIGTDAANAIKDVQFPGNTALLLFHLKEDHALTKQASTAVLTDKSLKELGEIFDMAFLNGKGIYQCGMNEQALKGVCDFIKQGISKTDV